MHAFEFDTEKSAANKEKHGINFIEAQKIWDDPFRLEIPAKTTDETRFLIIGKIKAKHWSAVITYREAETKIRLISVRRAREEERALYESE